MLRALILAGVSLMLIGFGAAGWQYWQGMATKDPAVVATSSSPEDLADAPQSWLISPTGGATPAADVRAYLVQGRSVPERSLRVTMTAPLADLLAEGESLPDPAYLQVMADIRAPLLAEGLCPVLSAAFAEKCAVASARVIPGTVDELQGTARFGIELYFDVKSDPAELPDLAQQVFETWEIALGPDAGSPRSAEEALQALTDQAAAACAVPEAGQSCRVLRMSLDFDPNGATFGHATLGAIRPLPETMRIVPELIPAPAG
jgi:hypothetical protein